MARPARWAPQSIADRASRSPGSSRARSRFPSSRRKASRANRPGGGRARQGHRRLDRVGERVVARGRRNASRLGQRELGVEQGDPKRRARIAAGHLVVGGGVGDERVRLGLAPGAGRGGHPDHGEQRAAVLAVAPVVGHPPAVREEEVGALGAVEGASARRGPRRSPLRGAGGIGRYLHHRGVRLVLEIMELHHAIPPRRRGTDARARGGRSPPGRDR